MNLVREKLFLLIIFVSVNVEVNGYTDLRLGGAHVCGRTRSYTEYSSYYYYTISYETYDSCCHRFLRACIGSCEKLRTKTYYMSRTISRTRYVTVPYCCPGWAKREDADDCQMPICNPSCRYGTCILPDKCKCNKGFEGRHCERDINECLSSPCQQLCTNLRGSYACSCIKGYKKRRLDPTDPACQDVNECENKICKCKDGSLGGCKANCTNTIGSFRCRCNSPGFELYHDKRTCIDVDECKSPSLNKCNQICINQPGTYTCGCRTGYEMGPDNHTCEDIDECKRLHGGCNQICINTPGSYHCSCKKGYTMGYNKRTCIDINECKTEKPCDRDHGTCTNYPGTYTCGCVPGFRLYSDGKTCKDIDECKSKSLNRCVHKCKNTIGSYKCLCKPGFRLNENGYSCDDINECKEGSHKCQQLCINTLGSYKCNCRKGYRLNFDQRTCRGNPCQSLSGPLNGKIHCSGMTTDKSCTFKCNFGHQLVGPVCRTCLPSGAWSGKPVSCEKMECGELVPPVDGSIVLPCIPKFGSTCLIKCNEGFYLKGSSINKCYIKTNQTEWIPNNATCKAAQTCSPNPCRNEGKCIEQSLSQYTCDCSNTEHIGQHCEIGRVTVPNYPQLTVGKQSEKLTISARPESNFSLGINLLSDNDALIIKPQKLYITKSVGEAEFTVTAKRPGLYTIRYDMVSLNSFNFQQPQEDKIYASQELSSLDPVDLSLEFYKDVCMKKKIDKKITLTSTCEFQDGSNGFVSLKSPFVHLPLSIVGINKTELASILENKTLLYVDNADEYLESGDFSKSCAVKEGCKEVKISDAKIDFIVKYNLFQRSFYKEVNKILPTFINLEADLFESYIDTENIMSRLGNGSKFINSSVILSNVPLEKDELYSVYQPLSITKIYFGSTYKATKLKNKPNCIVINLMKGDVHVKVDDRNAMDFGRMISTPGINVDTEIIGFGYGKQWRKCFEENRMNKCHSYNSYWITKTRIASKFENFAFYLNGLVFTDVIDGMFVEKLSRLRRIHFNGMLDFQMRFKMLGDWLTIDGTDPSASGFLTLGGIIHCPICDRNGFKTFLSYNESAFKYPRLDLLFEPKSKVSAYLPFDISGGLVKEIDKNKLQLRLRRLLEKRRIPDTLRSLYERLAENGLKKDLSIIKKYCTMMYNEFNKLFVKSKVKNLSYDSISKQLHLSREAADHCVSQLKYLQVRYPKKKTMIRKIGPLLYYSKSIYNMKLDIKTVPFKSLQQGKIVSYDGRFCLHSLCLNDMNVTIYDLSEDMLSNKHCAGCANGYKQLLRKDSITIEAVALKEVNMSRIRIESGNGIRLWIDKHSNRMNGTINATVNFFADSYKTTFVIENQIIRFRIDNVRLPSGSFVSVEGEENLLLTSWKSFVYRISGSSSDIRERIVKTAKKMFEEIAEETEKRLTGNRKRLKDVENELKSAILKKDKAYKNLKEADHERRIQEQTYKRLLLNLTTIQKNLDEELKGIDQDVFKENLDKVCTFQTCHDICLSIPKVCLCYTPIYVKQRELNCTKTRVLRREKITETFKTMCLVQQTRLDHIWTGTCDPDPAIQRRHHGQLTSAMGEIGAAAGSIVGDMVGTVVGGMVGGIEGAGVLGRIGAVVGSVVGRCIGKICAWFSSCDSSMINKEVKYYLQVPCVKLRSKYVTKEINVSHCFHVERKVQVGFKLPHQCKCQHTYSDDSKCDLKAKDSTCLSANLKCQKSRALFLKNNKKIPRGISRLYELRDNFQNNINATILKTRSALKRSEFYQDEYDRIINEIKVLEQDCKYAKRKIDEIQNLFKDEICLLDKYKHSEKLLKIDRISFGLTLPFLNNLELDIDVKHRGTVQRIPYIWQFYEDDDLSLKSAAKKYLVTSMCGDTLYLSISQNLDLSFKPWVTIKENHSAHAQITCSTYKRINDYLKTVFSNLKSKVDEAVVLKQEVEVCRKKLDPKLNLQIENEENSLLKANHDLIQDGVREVAKIAHLATLDHVKKGWREETEVITAVQNLTVCLNTEDCINQALKTLLNLPTMLKTNRRDYEMKLNVLKENINMIHQATNLHTLSEWVDKTLKDISSLDSISLHCAQAPQVLSQRQNNITAEVNDVITMVCQSKSELPVTWLWSHDGHVINGAYERIFTTKLSLDSFGMYKCHASSLAGNNSGLEIRVEVLQVPVFIEQPSNNTYVLSLNTDEKVTLVCNGTATPNPSITWYHSLFDKPNKFAKIKDSNEPVLALKSPTTAASGFYYCVLSNKQAEISSRVVRVDVLQAILPSAHLRLAFYSTKSQNQPLASFSNLKKNISKPLIKLHHDVKVIFKNGTLTIEEFVKADVLPSIVNTKIMLKHASVIRQGVANSAALLMNRLLRNNFTLLSDDGNVHTFLEDSMLYELKLNICQSGYEMHKNGYMCVQCPSGFAGTTNCKICPLNTFAEKPGLSECKKCKKGYVTLQQGSTSSSQCVLRPRCDQPCIHGLCIGINVCQCDQGWNGKHCESAICRRQCVHGQCVRPNECECKSGWKGNLCSEARCDQPCIHGLCIGINVCQCDQGWNGKHCESAICRRQCVHGQCVRPNECECKSGWKGNLCSEVSGPVPDIMILLDKSADYLIDNAFKIKTIKFIKNFMLDMGNYRFTRFGLITFDEKAKTEHRIDDFDVDTDISDWIQDMKRGSLHKNITAALEEVKFRNSSDFGQRRAVIILTNGHSKGSSKQDGFHMVRHAALQLQSQGIFMVPVCIASKCQKGEMLGIASYPKLTNTILKDDTKEASKSTLKAIRDYLKGVCFETKIDIGVLFKPQYFKDLKHYYTSRDHLVQLFVAIHNKLSKHKIYFAANEFEDDSVSKQFQEYDLASLNDTVREYHKQQKYYVDILDRAREILANEFDENVCKSYARIKSLIIITTHPIERQIFERLNREKGEEVEIVNFVYDSQSLSKVRDNKNRYYSYGDVNHYVESLKEKKRKLSNCNKDY